MSDLRPRASVVIPAHDEATVIERCLRALLEDVPPGALEVLVACNGCTDGTADLVRGLGLPVRVLEIEEASKVAALRTADRTTSVFPRIYLDADVEVPGGSLLAVADRLSAGPELAARPPFVYETSGASPLVRSYYRARSRVPELTSALWGAGCYAVSAAGHERIAPWPAVVADDLYVDRSFARAEFAIVTGAPVVVRTPLRTAALLAVLGRAYTGKLQSEQGDRKLIEAGDAPRARRTLAGVVTGVLRLAVTHPGHALDAAVYAGLAVLTRVRVRVGRRGAAAWARDHTSRAPA